LFSFSPRMDAATQGLQISSIEKKEHRDDIDVHYIWTAFAFHSVTRRPVHICISRAERDSKTTPEAVAQLEYTHHSHTRLAI
jgi:hypothetical protein